MTLKCSAKLLEEISSAARRKQLDMDGGMVGILLGRYERSTVEVIAWRTAAELSGARTLPGIENHGDRLTQAIADAAIDSETAQFQVCGWFVVRRSGELALTDAESEIFRRLFHHAWQVALLMRPGSRKNGARFFGRPIDGGRAGSVEVVELLSPGGAPSWKTAAKIRWGLGILGWLAAGSLAVCLWFGPGLWRRQPARLGLSLASTDATVHVLWDRHSPGLRGAERGTIEVVDGAKTNRYEFGKDELRLGSFLYARHTGDVLIRMKVFDRQGQAGAESIRFVAPQLPDPDSGVREETERTRKENEQLRRALARERAKTTNIMPPPATTR